VPKHVAVDIMSLMVYYRVHVLDGILIVQTCTVWIM